jgi:MFS family permease
MLYTIGAIVGASSTGVVWSRFGPGIVMLTMSGFVMGIGIGVYNVHLVARAMGSAAPGEQRSTASALTSVRSLGTAFGAAIAGVVATAAGLGDANEPEAVGNAVPAVYLFCWIPFGLTAALQRRVTSFPALCPTRHINIASVRCSRHQVPRRSIISCRSRLSSARPGSPRPWKRSPAQNASRSPWYRKPKWSVPQALWLEKSA